MIRSKSSFWAGRRQAKKLVFIMIWYVYGQRQMCIKCVYLLWLRIIPCTMVWLLSLNRDKPHCSNYFPFIFSSNSLNTCLLLVREILEIRGCDCQYISQDIQNNKFYITNWYHTKGSLQKKKPEIYWSFTNRGYPPSPL